MRHTPGKSLLRKVGAMLVALMALTAISCKDNVDPELPERHSGVELRLLYDYNMEFANSFYTQMSDLTILVYDIDGKYVTTVTESKENLSDIDYRLNIDLPYGVYHIVAYGGLNSSRASFAFDVDPGEITREQRRLRLVPDDSGGESSSYLQPLYYGSTLVVIDKKLSWSYTPAVIRMLKDTNDFRLVLQRVDGLPLDADDYDFEIVDDNILFNHDNSILPSTGIIYNPWAKGEKTTGAVVNGNEWKSVYAELSTSRLIQRGVSDDGDEAVSRDINGLKPGSSSVMDPRLRVFNPKTGRTILDVPLLEFLELYKSEIYSYMTMQEFLDRQSTWNMVFFLADNDRWISSFVEINGWTVRFNNIIN